MIKVVLWLTIWLIPVGLSYYFFIEPSTLSEEIKVGLILANMFCFYMISRTISKEFTVWYKEKLRNENLE